MTSDESKEESAKAGQHLNIKNKNQDHRIDNFNTDNKDIEIVKDFVCLGSVIISLKTAAKKSREG